MYGIFYDKISEGIENLPDMLRKLSEIYISNGIDYDEYNELKELAVEKASSKVDPTIETRLTQLESSVESLTMVVQRLCNKIDGLPDEGEDGYRGKDPSMLIRYENGMVALTGTDWIWNDGVWRSVAPKDYGLCWGPDVLPQYWENVTDEYNRSRILNPNVERIVDKNAPSDLDDIELVDEEMLAE